MESNIRNSVVKGMREVNEQAEIDRAKRFVINSGAFVAGVFVGGVALLAIVVY